MNRPLFYPARVISTFFIPPTLFIISFLFLALYYESPDKAVNTIIVSLLLGVIIPIGIFVYLVKSGKVVNQDATNKDERTTPYLLGILLYGIGLIALIYLDAGDVTISFWTTYLVNTIFILIINKFWKISAHALGVAGPLGLFYFLYGIYAYPFFILLLLVGWSRIYLKCHTPLQVLAGSLFGFFSVYLQLILMLN